MGLRINTNTASIAAQRNLSKNNSEIESASAKLSSGSRITKAADDAAGLAVSEKMKASLRSLCQADRNTNDGISMVQIAEGGLNEISSMLTRMRELGMQTASDTLSDSERSMTDIEYQQLKSEIDRISSVTEFNGKRLLNGEDGKYDFQVGKNNIDFEDRISFETKSIASKTSELGLEGVKLVSKEASQESLQIVDSAIEKLSSNRAFLGALQNRLTSTTNNLQNNIENLSSAHSRIRDLDYASATADQAKLGIINSAGTSVLAQANMSGQAAIKLIG